MAQPKGSVISDETALPRERLMVVGTATSSAGENGSALMDRGDGPKPDKSWAEDFAGGDGVSAVHSLVIKHLVVGVVSLLGLCLPVFAQETAEAPRTLSLYQTGRFAPASGSVLLRDHPITLSDGQFLPAATGLSQMGMVSLNFGQLAYLPVNKTVRSDSKGSLLPESDPSVSPPISVLDRLYFSGEVGVLYGRSTGKYGGELFQSHVFGTVGNEYFSLTAGAVYEESSVRYPRRRR